MQDAQGNLYGTTAGGGADYSGTVFKLDTTGKETVLYSFTGTGGDGAYPYAGLLQGAQGNMYGTTKNAGAHDNGTVFKLTPTSAPAAVELTPSYLVFPSAGSTLPLTVTNSGSADVNITAAPSIIGSNAPDFTIAGGTTCVGGTTIAPGQSCVVDVVFTPSAGSWEVATLLLFDNASYGPQTVPLSGGGQLISISPNPMPGSGSPQTVTITGTNFAAGAKINWQDLTASPWTGTITPQTVSPSTITASMNFTDASAIWQIEVINPGKPKTTSNWYPFPVVGSGSPTPALLDDYPFKNAPVDHLDPYDLAFDECTSYLAWRMNRDNGTTDPSNPSFFNNMDGGTWGNASNWGSNASNLHYKTDPLTNPEVGDIAQWTSIDHVAYVERVNSDGSIDVSEYNFGADDGTIKHQYGVRHVTSDAFPDEFIHISRLSLSPTSLDFGSQASGTSSSQTIAVTNSLAQTISLGVSIGASNAGVGTGDFTESNTCAGTSMPPGAQCKVSVTFAPPTTLTNGGTRSASIILNWGEGPQLIPVKGVALTSLTVSPKALSFGSVTISNSVSKSVTLKNSTGRDVTISSLVISGSAAFTQSATTCGTTLKWNSSCTVTVTFLPNAAGKSSGTLTITDDAINNPQTVPLSGTGVLPATLTPATATYAAQAVGTTSAPKTFTLTNNQTVALTGIAISTTGDFAVSATTCTASLAAKTKCTISVTFTPTVVGTRKGTLSVSDSASNSPQASNLTGTGK